MATPIEPMMAMPRAPPSSAPVSEIPEAAPACSGGAEPTISSVVSPNTGASPSEMITEPSTSGTSPPVTSTWESRNRPTADRARPPEITKAGRTLCRTRGANWLPMMNAAAEGSDHSPASSGDSPTTNWRYWATNRK